MNALDIHGLFEPLGYTVEIQGHPLDARFPEWGTSPYFSVDLTSESRLYYLLAQLYVLLPVLDDNKHYWVGNDEVDKLLRFGEGSKSHASGESPWRPQRESLPAGRQFRRRRTRS